MTPGVLNTRPRQQTAKLSRLLRNAGYLPFEIALVELILIPEGLSELAKVSPDAFDGVLLSSPNLLPLLEAAGVTVPENLLTKEWYLISVHARSQLEALGAKVTFVPRNASLEGFYSEFTARPGLRILHPCSRATRLDPELFLEKGIIIHNMPLYAPHCPAGIAFELGAVWHNIQAALFASGSSVRNLFSAVPGLAHTLGAPAGPLPISIGPSASEALHAQGIHNFREAVTADNSGLISALNAVFKNSTQKES